MAAIAVAAVAWPNSTKKGGAGKRNHKEKSETIIATKRNSVAPPSWFAVFVFLIAFLGILLAGTLLFR